VGWTPDQTKLTEMQGANLKQLDELNAKTKVRQQVALTAHTPTRLWHNMLNSVRAV
jgi:hypothetical protein